MSLPRELTIAYRGGGLATFLALNAPQMKPPVRIDKLVLVLPWLNQAKEWTGEKFTLGISPEKLDWCRKQTCPNPNDRKKWQVSPVFAPEKILKNLPPVFIAVGGLDLLRDDGLKFQEMLEACEVTVTLKEYAGASHALLRMAGKARLGMELLTDILGQVCDDEGFRLPADILDRWTEEFKAWELRGLVWNQLRHQV
jgi:acetyl esterase/lipase